MIAKRPTAIIMALTNVRTDPRPMRFANVAKSLGYSITLCGLAGGEEGSTDPYVAVQGRRKNLSARILRKVHYGIGAIPARLGLRDALNKYRFNLHTVERHLQNNHYDLLVVHDLYLLPLAIRFRGRGRVVFDAREYYPDQDGDSLMFQLFEHPERLRLCKQYLASCDAIATVSPGIAELYRNKFLINMNVVYSVRDYHISSQSRRISAETDQCLAKPLRLVHHGGSNRNRNLTRLVEIVELCQGVSLDLYLVPNNEKELSIIKERSKFIESVNVRDPVPYDEIPHVVECYDLGIIYFEPTTTNLLHSMPNKLFDYIQARVPVLVGPSPDMAKIVKEYNCGIVVKTFDMMEVVQTISNLKSSDLNRMREGCERAARVFCNQIEDKKIHSLYQR